MNITQELEDAGIKIESLNIDERKTYLEMLNVVQQSQLSLEKLKEYITSMREAVERELVSESSFIRVFIFKVENPKLIKLQARL